MSLDFMQNPHFQLTRMQGFDWDGAQWRKVPAPARQRPPRHQRGAEATTPSCFTFPYSPPTGQSPPGWCEALENDSQVVGDSKMEPAGPPDGSR